MFSNERDTALGESPTGAEWQIFSLLEQRDVIPAKTEEPLREE